MPYVVVERDSGGVGSFLLGAILGAGVALLLAPRTGEETQRDLKERAARLREAAEGRVRDVQRQVEERIGQARGEVLQRVDSIREAVDSGREAAQQARVELEGHIERSKAAYRASAEAARDATGEEGEEA
jgi:gas vesicle protein